MYDTIIKTIQRFHTKSTAHKKNLLNVPRDWTVLLVALFIINVASIAVHVYASLQVQNFDVYTETETPSVETINRSALAEVLEVYEEKERRFEDLQSSPPATTDPAQ